MGREKRAVLSFLTVIVLAVMVSWFFSRGCAFSGEDPVAETPGSSAVYLPLDTIPAKTDSLKSHKKKRDGGKSGKNIDGGFPASSPLDRPVKRHGNEEDRR